jgi:superfamily I DNA/RNA helicase
LVQVNSQNEQIEYIEAQINNLMGNGLTSHDIAILCHTKANKQHWMHLQKLGVHLASFGTMKGLEFQAVFLPDLHTTFQSDNPHLDVTQISEMRRVLFTAMTRARQYLIMTYQSKLPQPLQPIAAHAKHQQA